MNKKEFLNACEKLIIKNLKLDLDEVSSFIIELILYKNNAAVFIVKDGLNDYEENIVKISYSKKKGSLIYELLL